MRSINTIYIVLITAIALPRGVFGLESPGASNPLGLGTIPPTAYRSGLIPSIKPIDTSGNLIVTGNVTGGMQFRGVVPYSSGTDFYATSGSLSSTSGGIDSFLKRTEGSQYGNQAGRGLTPYYSPSMTVSKMIPGSGGMITTQSTVGNIGQQHLGAGLQAEQLPLYQRRVVPSLVQRPLSLNPQEMEMSIEADVSKYLLGGEKTAEERSKEYFWKQMGIERIRNPEAQDDTEQQPGSSKPSIGAYLEEMQIRRPELQSKRNFAPETASTGSGETSSDIYEQMKIKAGLSIPGLTGEVTASEIQQAEPNAGASTESMTGHTEMLFYTYKSFAAYHEDKFNRNMRAAEHYMKQQRYYMAADAYTVATVYKPDDPLGYAGKSIALFAAGEYMSSALFLARAMEIFPEYPKIRVDLFEMTGDKDTVERRIVEAREWLQKSESGELAFLLSYVYYQLDRLEFSRQAIEYAAKKLPDSRVTAAMKSAVDERLGKK